MDADDPTWRWLAGQLDVLAEIARAGDLDDDAPSSVEALESRMRVARQAAQLVDDLVNRLMLALLDAGATPGEVAELMGLISTQAVHRRAKRARRRLGAVDTARRESASVGEPDGAR